MLFSLKKRNTPVTCQICQSFFVLTSKNLPPRSRVESKARNLELGASSGEGASSRSFWVFWCWEFFTHKKCLISLLVCLRSLAWIKYTRILFVYIHTYILAKNQCVEYFGEIFLVAESQYVYFLFGCTICPHGVYKHAVTGLTRLHLPAWRRGGNARRARCWRNCSAWAPEIPI